MIDYSKRTFAVYVKAVLPRMTCQVRFSENPIEKDAIEECLADFDKHYPECVDRTVYKVLPYAEYQRRIDEMAEMNSFMNS